MNILFDLAWFSLLRCDLGSGEWFTEEKCTFLTCGIHSMECVEN